ncbi:hypothetical protein F5984_00745 [Rudanella paleaurantiibacter]|uniref:Uncharacterized protein n=1 Tax=Rudanella paleaurantiibacter TaxID=2614655 RepID=A0A7J5U4A1_9BACT|nr:WG repeat-containing protein [Rudanella paleaurantiibacter]KAB7732523.1 hypothetical protein F5984_00745 [Rudanella paleaurantiibacter]
MATLQERIKEEIVLRRGQVKERHWRQTGLPEEAAREGISAEEFRRLVNEVSRQINFEKLADLRRRLEDALAAPPLYQLHQTQTDDFVAEAERMGLGSVFVRDRWIPQLITDLKQVASATTEVVSPPLVAPPVPETPVAPTTTPPVEASDRDPVAQPDVARPNAARPDDAAAVRARVKTILDEYEGHITARELRLLFRAMPTDEKVLAEEVLAYLSANFYASVTEPAGNTLSEKLLSTDWRHLSWWDKEPEPAPAPVVEPVRAYVPPTPPPQRPAPTPPPAPRRSSLWSDAGVWGTVFAVSVVIILYLLIKPNAKNRNTGTDEDRPARSEQVEETRPSKRKREKAKRTSEAVTSNESEATDEPMREPKTAPEPAPTEKPVVVEESKPDKKYDQVLATTGDFGERPARLGRKWGLWRDNNWMIFPIYDDITVFRDGRATVVRNGRTYDIDDKGNPVE